MGFPKVNISAWEVEIELPPESETSFYQGERFQNLMTIISSRQKRGFALKQVGKKLTLSAKLMHGKDSLARLHSTIEIMKELGPEEEAIPVLMSQIPGQSNEASHLGRHQYGDKPQ